MNEMNNLNNQSVTPEILLENGFIEINDETMKRITEENGIFDYREFSLDTDKYDGDKNCIHILISNNLTNSDRNWYVHVDNSTMQSIGSADIETVEQFNLFLSVFDTKFKLQ